MNDAVLTVRDLCVSIGSSPIVQNVSFELHRGETLGIVGESGSGKSMTMLAATGLLDAPGAVVTGSSVLARPDAADVQLVGASPRLLRSVHGGRIGFVFQDPSTSLNPMLTLERQITESLEAHRRASGRAARMRALELLEAVGLPDPASRLRSYPHQLSGGQRQRVMIAIALACDPEVLIADEPTTALDVTTQAQIIELVRALQNDFGTAVIWVSHDLGVIGQVADDVAVLRGGSVVEQRPVLDIFDRPKHDYTRELLAARPVIRAAEEPTVLDSEDDGGSPLLSVEGLDVRFPVSTPVGRSIVHAVKGVSFRIRRGETLGLVGESGSGKSTVAGALTGLVDPHAGAVSLHGGDGDVDVLQVKGQARRAVRRRISMVFQDPFSSLNLRNPIGASIAEPLRVHRLAHGSAARRARGRELLDLVGLPTAFAERYPHELSGGQRQRVSIARALAVEPELMILDESTASLDVSVQAKVLDLLAELQREFGLTYLFIAHDLAIVQQMSHDVLVMRAGESIEYRPAAQLFSAPREQYTRSLLAAVPPERPRAAVS
ncbi:peptide/nickel transport system ATP-binding protein [Paramicrobacterium humi]|uniref:Peptide/nickel transport system ATP-binding protein n=1 Tax=Paramicrobacterium humi TaxID=640635 RepID=A0A1H4KLI0_9MICO|nr:ABC transporter ATP-binding protein [Microbacterium humi]SEB59370.1 peptide/nickel transport system ATP-binding protein [Microbacterium humi]